MILLNDLTNIDGAEVPSTINKQYRWGILPAEIPDDDNELLLILSFYPTEDDANDWALYPSSINNAVQLESISLKRGIVFYLANQPNTENIAQAFSNWIFQRFAAKVVTRALEPCTEEEPWYDFFTALEIGKIRDNGFLELKQFLEKNFFTFFTEQTYLH